MPFRSVVISSGHGKYIRGAAGPLPWGLDEVDEARRVVNRVADLLRARAVGVKTFHDDTSRDQNTNLKTIVNYHNSQVRELDVSVHFNATAGAKGTECLYVTQSTLSAQIAAAISTCGFVNRGAKYRSDLYFLNNTAKPSILIEVCFVDTKSDCDTYRANFEQICLAVADVLGGASETQPIPPPEPGPDPEQPEKSRPLIGKGDYGNNVAELQTVLQVGADGDFGPQTYNAVQQYQLSKGLSVDGLVGSQTWAALGRDYQLAPYPPPLPPLLSDDAIAEILEIAASSPIASYAWRDRGRAPSGYTNGMAVAYAQAVARFHSHDPIAAEWAKANTGNDSIDAISWYNSNFAALGMNNDRAGLDTLRHLYVLLMGLGMRESSGKYCTGRDQSASNTTSDTCEAGLFQTSWNARACCTDFINLADQYDPSSPQGYQSVFSRAVTCSASDWSSYGSGDGYQFQETAKWSPVFAVETAATGLRNLRQHWGPINRKEAELKREADEMFQQIEAATAGAVA